MYEKVLAYFVGLAALMFLVWFGLMKDDQNENLLH